MNGLCHPSWSPVAGEVRQRSRRYLSAGLLVVLSFWVQIVQAHQTAVGAIRWDAWCGDLTDSALATERSLGPGKYHCRLPFYGTELSQSAALARFTTQSVMDQEIAYAKNAGLNYWAFLYYRDGSGLDLAHDLYLTSAHRNDLGFCMIVQAWLYDDTAINQFVQWFQLPCYQKVAGGRPLLYFFDTAGITKAKVDQLRAQTIAAGLPSPYLVSMAQGSLGDVTTLGLDAVSAYTQFSGSGSTYASYASTIRGLWDTRKNAGYKVIPWISTGVDNRPRADNTVPWNAGSTVWVQQPSPGELAAELQSALDWVNADPGAAEAGSILIYAWNEFDEGGWICPTLYFGADRLNALAQVLGGIQQAAAVPPTPGPNLVLGRTASASSQKTGSEPAGAMDGNMNTAWCASDSDIAGSWLAVDLGSPVAFNRVVLREQVAQSITAHKVQYQNGTDWIDLAEGTRAGPYEPFVFSTVTARALRVLITAATTAPRLEELEVYFDPSFQPFPDGLACSWSLDGNANDPAGSRHGRLAGGPVFETGLSGQALRFDGTDDQMIVADTAGTHTAKLDSSGAVTVALWLYLDQLPSLPCLVANKSGQLFLKVNSNGTGAFSLATDSATWGSSGTSAAFTTPLATGVWYHLAGVYDGSNVMVYVNGQLAGTGSQPINGSLTNTAEPLVFGKGASGTNSFFKGRLDDVRVFSRALDSAAVRSLRDASLAERRGLWHLDEGGGLLSKDSAGTNPAALLNGASWCSAYLGQGLGFDGVDDFVEIPDNGVLNGMDTLTVSAWVNLGRVPASGFSATPVERLSLYRFTIGSTGAGHFVVRTANNGWYSTGTVASFSTPLSLNAWHHLVGTYDGDRVRVYVDGVLQGTGSQSISGPISNNNGSLRLGYKGATNLEYFCGKIDEIEVRARCLTDAEVGNLYTETRSFEAWRNAEFSTAELNDSNIAGADADPDHDGLSNFGEYAFHRSPKSSETPAALGVIPAHEETENRDYLMVTYGRLRQPRLVSYHIEVSEDLVTWGETPSLWQQETAVADPNGLTETVSLRSVAPLDQLSVRFFRLRVTMP